MQFDIPPRPQVRGFLDASSGWCSQCSLTIPPRPFKVSQCPMATIFQFYQKAVEGLYWACRSDGACISLFSVILHSSTAGVHNSLSNSLKNGDCGKSEPLMPNPFLVVSFATVHQPFRFLGTPENKIYEHRLRLKPSFPMLFFPQNVHFLLIKS